MFTPINIREPKIRAHNIRAAIAALMMILLLVPVSSSASDAELQRGTDAYLEGDYETAADIWHLLAERGLAKAQFSLGIVYSKGHGVPQDYAKAVKWYRRAAEQGYASAQTNLGFMYGKGHGLPQNYVLAHMWYNLAALQGEELSLDSGDGESGNRDKIARRMTPAQIARAQELAAQCLASNYQDCAE